MKNENTHTHTLNNSNEKQCTIRMFLWSITLSKIGILLFRSKYYFHQKKNGFNVNAISSEVLLGAHTMPVYYTVRIVYDIYFLTFHTHTQIAIECIVQVYILRTS